MGQGEVLGGRGEEPAKRREDLVVSSSGSPTGGCSIQQCQIADGGPRSPIVGDGAFPGETPAAAFWLPLHPHQLARSGLGCKWILNINIYKHDITIWAKTSTF